MGRGGPCMTRTKAREVVEALGIKVEHSDGLGIQIERYANNIGYESWRVYTGGGIAGNSDSAWLAPAVRSYGQPRGPFWNKAQLTKALRLWRREHIPDGWRTQRRLSNEAVAAGAVPRFEESIDLRCCGEPCKLVGNLSLRGAAGATTTRLGYECTKCFKRIQVADAWDAPDVGQLDCDDDAV